MNRMKMAMAVVFALLLVVPSVARAQQKGVELIQVLEKEVTKKNTEGKPQVTRVPVDKANVIPGDVVVFTFYYTNNGSKPATDAVIKNPVPEHMIYIDHSAEGKGTRIEFSTDKGKTFAPAEKLKVKAADGKERPAGASDYNFIRWTIEKPLEKGAKGSVSFKARVR